MKRKLALLLTVLITAAAVPSAQLMAAETGPEIITEEEETAPEEASSVPENDEEEADGQEENGQPEEIPAEQEPKPAEDPAEAASEGLTEEDGIVQDIPLILTHVRTEAQAIGPLGKHVIAPRHTGVETQDILHRVDELLL